MQRLIPSLQIYKVLDKDPTSSTERKMNAALLRLKKNGTIAVDGVREISAISKKMRLNTYLPYGLE